MKNFIFKYYLIIAVFAFALISAITAIYPDRITWPIIASLVTAVLSFVYVTLKQGLEELKFFKELFTEFNNRYNDKNEELNVILKGDQNTALTKEEIDVLYDYFNLCGEEYLYYQKGYIYPEVWRAWLNGMKTFYDSPRIRKLWDEELATNSYYGLRIA